MKNKLKGSTNMNYDEAIAIIGRNRAKWELNHMKKALSLLPFLNTIEEERRLKAIKIILKHNRS